MTIVPIQRLPSRTESIWPMGTYDVLEITDTGTGEVFFMEKNIWHRQ